MYATIHAKRILAAITFAMIPTLALASDMTGLLSIMMAAFFLAPWILINLVVMIVYSLDRRYASLRFARKHALIASIGPLLGAAAVYRDFTSSLYSYHRQEMIPYLAIMAGLLALSWLPVLIHRFQRQRDA